jgi:outer membrane protein assembly factor BamB
MIARIAALAAAAALAQGCSSFTFFGLFEDSAKKPMALAEIRPLVTPKLAWSTTVGKAGRFRFTPAVEGGRIYAAAADGTVSVIEEDNGKLIVRHDAKKPLSSGAAAAGGNVMVGTIKGEVLALDAGGKLLWTANVAGEVLAPARVAGSSVIVRTSDGRIFAFALADGKRRWVYQRAAPSLLLRSEAGVIATVSSVVAGYPGGKLIALDLEDGKLTWEVTVSQPRGATELERVADVGGLPVIDGTRICAVAFQGKAACFDIQGGNTVWTRDLSSASGLVVDDKNAYLSDDKDNVQALDKATGTSRWKQDKLLRRKLTSPVVAEGKVVVGDGQGYLHVLSPDDGAIVGRVATDGTAVTALVPVTGGLLVQTAGGMLALVRF